MTNDIGLIDGEVRREESLSPGTTKRIVGAIKRHWAVALVVAVAVMVWLPRLSGPIDLRWDAGVYYLLGTSLSEGHGYRILSEPGAPEAVQYPPMLPAFVALHQLALGSRDPGIVGPWLRRSYAVLFLGYGLAVLALARRYLRRGWAVLATLLCLLHHSTVFLSDLVFAELPFALVSVVFALVATSDPSRLRPWLLDAFSFAIAAIGFLLRTAGVALLIAWVFQALMRAQWRLAIIRAVLISIPIIGWQAHVARVAKSSEFIHPAYEYQRASYQYYNVSYAENISLVDPFRPELGRTDARTLAARLLGNIPPLAAALGEAVSARANEWPFQRAYRLQNAVMPTVGDRPDAGTQSDVVSKPKPGGKIRFVFVPILCLSALVLGGVLLLALRGAWLTVAIIAASLALICTTPWPSQFTRYIAPLAPFLAISAVVAMCRIFFIQWGKRFRHVSLAARIAVAGLLLVTLAGESYATLNIFRGRQSKGARVVASQPTGSESRLFFHDRSWRDWEEATNWIKQHSRPDEIVVTSSPHLCYLRTGLHSVLPPMESDPERERQLLAALPASYVIVDNLEFLDISRRYAEPAIEGDPAGWRLVYSVNGTNVYQHVSGAR